jgi:hypothetical protein
LINLRHFWGDGESNNKLRVSFRFVGLDSIYFGTCGSAYHHSSLSETESDR